MLNVLDLLNLFDELFPTKQKKTSIFPLHMTTTIVLFDSSKQYLYQWANDA